MFAMPRRAGFYFLAILFVALLMANVIIGFRFQQLRRSIGELEAEQRNILEENKRLIATIAILRSPERISDLAVEELELERTEPPDILRIEIDQQ